jgi:diguanylate cyclase (GGDEF)-like protein
MNLKISENAPPNLAGIDGPLRSFMRFTRRHETPPHNPRLERHLAAYSDMHGTEEAVLNHLSGLTRRWLPWCDITVVPAGMRQPPPLSDLTPCFTLPAWNGDPHRVFTHTQTGRRFQTRRHQRRVQQIERHLTRHMRSLRDEATPVPNEAWRRLRHAEKRIETAGSVPQLKTAIARYARAACMADTAVVLVRRGDRLLRAAHVGHLQRHEALLTPEGLPFSGALKEGWTAGRPVFRTGATAALGLLGLDGLQAYALLPLRYDAHDTEAVVLVLFDRHAHVWTDEERRRLHAASKIAEIMLERLLLRKRNDALSSMVARLSGAGDPVHVAAELEASLRAFRPETGRLTVWWRNGERFQPSSPARRPDAPAEVGAMTAAALAERYNLPLRALRSTGVTVTERDGFRTVVLPLAFAGETPAVAVLEERMHGTPLDRGSIAVLEAYAQQAGLLIVQQTRGAVWQDLAQRDTLTGLPNRLAFDQAFARATRRAAFAATPVALLLMDINRFKRVNDELGHAAGDDLLKQAAPVLTAALGVSGTLHRWAGDEFAALMPGATPEAAQAAAVRLRAAFAPLAPLPGVGLSVGTACFPDVPASDLLLTADAGMYADKPSRAPRN